MSRALPLLLAGLLASASPVPPCPAPRALPGPPAPVVAVAAVQAEVPANDGWITDLAGVLDAGQERALESLEESYRQGSTNEVAVLLVPTLGGRTIEELALETARAWGIGSKETSNGALLVVAMAERELRIEVGRGLEGNLTDSISGRIIRDVIAPEFKRGRVYEGLEAGLRAIHAAAGGDYGPLRTSRSGRARQGGGIGCFSLVLVAVFLLVLLRGGGRRGGGGLGSFFTWMLLSQMLSGSRRGGGFGGGGHGGGGFGGGGGGFGGFGGGGGFSGGGSSGGW